MKKTLPILSLLAASALSASAYDFGFLTFTTADGGAASIPTEALEIRYSDGMLTAVSGETTLTLPTASLVKMEFTTEGTTTDPSTGIADIIPGESAGPIRVYTTDGIYLGTFDTMADVVAGVEKGNYIMIINGKAIKTAL